MPEKKIELTEAAHREMVCMVAMSMIGRGVAILKTSGFSDMVRIGDAVHNAIMNEGRAITDEMAKALETGDDDARNS